MHWRCLRTWLLAILMHAASNAASQWLTQLIAQSGLALPEAGLLGWLVGDGWIHTLVYGAAALLLLALTRGRLGAVSATPPLDAPTPGRA